MLTYLAWNMFQNLEKSILGLPSWSGIRTPCGLSWILKKANVEIGKVVRAKITQQYADARTIVKIF